MRLLGVPEGLWGSLWIFGTLWYTWESETPGCARGLMVFSGALKPSGTLGRTRLLRVPGFYGLLWIFESPLAHFKKMRLLNVPEG